MKGRERYENFVETLGRRLAKGQTLLRDLPEEAGRPTGVPLEQTDTGIDSSPDPIQALRSGSRNKDRNGKRIRYNNPSHQPT